MNPEQKAALLKSILVASGVVPATATDEQVQMALSMQKQQDPAATNAMLANGGYPVTPWLTYLGLGAGAIALYFVWQNYTKTKKLGVIDRPDAEEEEIRPRLKNMGRTLGHFKGRSGSSCRPMGRGPAKRRGLGGTEKYEFEPESRLEGFRGKRRSKRSAR